MIIWKKIIVLLCFLLYVIINKPEEGKQMEALLNQGWYALQMYWSGAKYEITGHIIIVVTIGAVLILIWVFMSPQVGRKGS